MRLHFINFPLAHVLLIAITISSACKKDDEKTTPTPPPNNIPTTVTDFDNNTYNVIPIGGQYFTTQNLKVKHYRNGDPIPEVKDPTDWLNLVTGAWCYYNNDSTNEQEYGILYNWYAVTDPRGIAPSGWKVPSETQLTTTINFLGGDAVAGGKLKEAGLMHWDSPNFGATNSSGFTGLAAGRRYNTTSEFDYMGVAGYWWCENAANLGDGATLNLTKDSESSSFGDSPKREGRSVRLIYGQ